MVIGSFHLLRFGATTAARQLARVPLDRRALRQVHGARFAKLLGTGRGRRMTTSVDPTRWAVFVVWDDESALDAFSRSHPVAVRWRDAVERYDVVLEPLGAHGSWDGGDPVDGTGGAHGRDRAGEASGPIAVLTRATVRWSKVPAFVRAVPPVDRSLEGVDGLLAAVGIGELPVGRQATFSLWRDAGAVDAFAYRSPRHSEVVTRTRDEGWYGEEWFARFRPLRWSGTWDGADPLG